MNTDGLCENKVMEGFVGDFVVGEGRGCDLRMIYARLAVVSVHQKQELTEESLTY